MLCGENPRPARIGAMNGRNTPWAAPVARNGPRSTRILVATTSSLVTDPVPCAGGSRLRRSESRTNSE